MGKLNQRKIRWILREMDRGKSSSSIAAVQKVSQRRVQQLYKQYKDTGEISILQKRGRKKRKLTTNEESIILDAYEEYKVNALALEKVIDRYYKIHIPHNRIHQVLKTNNKANDEPNKQKQRKWVRYERKHSLSLVHVDWHEHGNIQVIAYLDDASRKILAAGEFDSANIENGIRILGKAVKEVEFYGPIRALLSDNGSEFSSHWKHKKEGSTGVFQKHLEQYGIKHITTSVNHPQTNGKLEKWFDLYERRRDEFDTLEGFIGWYNDKRPHASLDFENAETPSEAFTRKLRLEDVFHAMVNLFGW
jgi:putative transposase